LTADAVSWVSLGLAAAAGTAFATRSFGAGAALSAASAVCDGVDGMVARETGTASDAGEVLDATVDRYAELLMLGGIAYSERDEPFGFLLALGALAGALMVSYSSAKAEAMHVEAPRGSMRRQERAVYLILGAALVPPCALAASRAGLPAWCARAPLYAALALIGLIGNVSAVRRLAAVARATRRRDSDHCADHALARNAHAAAGDAFR
jgi:CDP-diacylglycerol--glycerol-3-phosphate 3-phosphatidyltransferase